MPGMATSSTTAIAISQRYHSALVALLQRPCRGRPPGWRLHCPREDDAELAARIIETCIRPRVLDAERAPSVLSVARGLGWYLVPELTELAAVGLGGQLLMLAHRAGLIEDIRGRVTRPGESRQDTQRVRLTAGASKHIEALVACASMRPPLPKPPAPGARINMNHEGLLPLAVPSEAVNQAATKVAETPWRVNEYMLRVLTSRLTPSQWRHLMRGPADPRVKRVHKRHQLYAIGQAVDIVGRGNAPFYLPVELDFRGRMYQQDSYQNAGCGLQWTSGAKKVGRVLLEFADSQSLDAHGYGWLCYQLAQLWGAHSSELELGQGQAWADGSRTRKWISKCVYNPQRHTEWLRARKPLAFLATAQAWLHALHTGEYRLPIVLDASCSGLQHLCLLVRDETIAPHVNIAWGGERGDFYALVAQSAGERSRDAAKAALVPWLYGAGPERSAEALADEEGASSVRAKHIQRATAIRNTASGSEFAARSWAVFKWLQSVVKAFNGDGKERPAREIHWNTPSGLRLVQDYRWMVSDEQRTPVYVPGQRTPIRLRSVHPGPTIDRKQQATSFPANYVHSLDAAFLVALLNRPEVSQPYELLPGFIRPPIDRWAVAHDAFGVPASQVWQLLQAVKPALLDMYEPDRLTELWQDLLAQGVEVPAPPIHEPALPDNFLETLYTIG